MLDRVVIGYSALGNRGLLWVAAGVVVGLATQRYRAIVLVPAVVWITLGLNYGIKRIVRRERPLERHGRAPLITAPATPSFPSSHAAMAAAGWDAVVAAAPGHVATVREHVTDPLSRSQLKQLTAIGDALLTRLDPDGAMRPLLDPAEPREA